MLDIDGKELNLGDRVIFAKYYYGYILEFKQLVDQEIAWVKIFNSQGFYLYGRDLYSHEMKKSPKPGIFSLPKKRQYYIKYVK